MNFNNFTIKSQEALQLAGQIALGNEQQSIEPGHLLKAIFEVDENVTPFLFKKMAANLGAVRQAIDAIVKGYPKIAGGQQNLSRPAGEMVQHASVQAKKMGDEYVSLEHLLLGSLKVNDVAVQVLKDAGINEKVLRQAIDELRQGKKVTSNSAENSYNSLEKYAINLNERARSGKLDPVIGRDEEIRRVLHILARRSKNNPILIGEPGVGKTAIVEGLAHRIVNGDVPEDLRDKDIYSLDMGAL
ncbi:MAG: Clp protease N-terminal domain-containing protein, partial [Bacteroidota bacterium]